MRFIPENIWEEAWFASLPAWAKTFYLFAICRCDNTGVLNIAPKIAEAILGQVIEWDSIQPVFSGRIVKFREGWLLPAHTRQQFPRLESNLPLRKGLSRLMKKHRLAFDGQVMLPIEQCKEGDIAPRQGSFKDTMLTSDETKVVKP